MCVRSTCVRPIAYGLAAARNFIIIIIGSSKTRNKRLTIFAPFDIGVPSKIYYIFYNETRARIFKRTKYTHLRAATYTNQTYARWTCGTCARYFRFNSLYTYVHIQHIRTHILMHLSNKCVCYNLSAWADAASPTIKRDLSSIICK